MKNKRKLEQLIIVILILISVVSLVVTFARYLVNNINDFFLKSKEFYFASDKLSEDGAVFQIDNWSGVDSYTITINMNSRKNNLEVADYDIEYDISYSVSDNVTCQLSKTSGTILASTNSDTFNFILTPNTQLTTGDKVVLNVTTKSKTNYEKTLSGKFTLVVGKENLSYEVVDSAQQPYLMLNLMNTVSYYTAKATSGSYNRGDKIDVDTYLSLTDSEKTNFCSSSVTISFDPAVVLLDITNENYDKFTNIQTTVINGKHYISGFKVEIDAISSMNIRFYKVNVSQNYTYPGINSSCIITVV